MAYVVPEKYRLTEKVAQSTRWLRPHTLGMVNDITHGDDGYFFFPRLTKDKGYYFLCKTSMIGGWRYIACIIPSSSIPPTWEELNYLKRFFVGDDHVIMVHPSKGPYLDESNKGWVYLWHKEDMEMPPIENKVFGIRKSGFAVWVYRKLKRDYKRSFLNFMVLKFKKFLLKIKKK